MRSGHSPYAAGPGRRDDLCSWPPTRCVDRRRTRSRTAVILDIDTEACRLSAIVPDPGSFRVFHGLLVYSGRFAVETLFTIWFPPEPGRRKSAPRRAGQAVSQAPPARRRRGAGVRSSPPEGRLSWSRSIVRRTDPLHAAWPWRRTPSQAAPRRSRRRDGAPRSSGSVRDHLGDRRPPRRSRTRPLMLTPPRPLSRDAHRSSGRLWASRPVPRTALGDQNLMAEPLLAKPKRCLSWTGRSSCRLPRPTLRRTSTWCKAQRLVRTRTPRPDRSCRELEAEHAGEAAPQQVTWVHRAAGR